MLLVLAIAVPERLSLTVTVGDKVSPAIASELLATLLMPLTVNLSAATLMAPLNELIDAVGVKVAV